VTPDEGAMEEAFTDYSSIHKGFCPSVKDVRDFQGPFQYGISSLLSFFLPRIKKMLHMLHTRWKPQGNCGSRREAFVKSAMRNLHGERRGPLAWPPSFLVIVAGRGH
jgi:hypothetical protein